MVKLLAIDMDGTLLNDKKHIENDRKVTQIKNDRRKLLSYIHDSIKALKDFYYAKVELSKFDVTFETKELVVAGHTLSIKNSFKLTEDEFLVNTCEFFWNILL